MLNAVRVSWRPPLFLLALLLSVGQTLIAQDTVQITGSVRSSTDAPLDGAYVIFWIGWDSSTGRVVKTDSRGAFTFELEERAFTENIFTKIEVTKDGYNREERGTTWSHENDGQVVPTVILTPTAPAADVGQAEMTAFGEGTTERREPLGAVSGRSPWLVGLVLVVLLTVVVGILIRWVKKNFILRREYERLTRIKSKDYASSEKQKKTEAKIFDLESNLRGLQKQILKTPAPQQSTEQERTTGSIGGTGGYKSIRPPTAGRKESEIVKAYNAAIDSMEYVRFLKSHTYKRVGVGNADDRARNPSKAPDPEFVDEENGVYLRIKADGCWLMVPWFGAGVIDAHLYSVGALEHVFHLVEYDPDKSPKILIKKAAEVQECDGKWRVGKKGELTCSLG